MANRQPRKGKHHVFTKAERQLGTAWTDRIVNEGAAGRAATASYFDKKIAEAETANDQTLADRMRALHRKVLSDAEPD